MCDEHVVLIGQTREAACEAIRRRKVDVLFDLNGILREDFPVEIFGMRGAPVQAGWWNTPVSCGLDSVQYFFMDRSILDATNHDLFTETIVEIPGGATLCYELSDREPVAPAPYLASRTFTFGSFTALFKTNDVVLDSWAQILARTPHTQLYIKAAGSTSERFQRRLACAIGRHGVDRRRIACEEVDTFDVMMARFAAVDLCLNTYNYGTGTTALNAVWQGVPTLTFNGSLHYARHRQHDGRLRPRRFRRARSRGLHSEGRAPVGLPGTAARGAAAAARSHPLLFDLALTRALRPQLRAGLPERLDPLSLERDRCFDPPLGHPVTASQPCMTPYWAADSVAGGAADTEWTSVLLAAVASKA